MDLQRAKEQISKAVSEFDAGVITRQSLETTISGTLDELVREYIERLGEMDDEDEDDDYADEIEFTPDDDLDLNDYDEEDEQ